jgi:hypothetical protein
MNVGPARAICLTRKLYHQAAPHRSPFSRFSGLPTSSIGELMITGMNTAKRYTNRLAVRTGSMIQSFSSAFIRARRVLWGSAGDRIRRAGSDERHGMTAGDERMVGIGDVSRGTRYSARPAAKGTAAKAARPVVSDLAELVKARLEPKVERRDLGADETSVAGR